jgi:hypothetical protein
MVKHLHGFVSQLNDMKGGMFGVKVFPSMPCQKLKVVPQ